MSAPARLAHLDVAKAGVATRGTAFVLHGILGSAGNWRSFVRRLVEANEDAAQLRWVLVDLRAHGDSERGTEPHTVDACAADVAHLATTLGATIDLVLGHSFGGKVALALAAHHSPATRAAWFLDTPPGPTPLSAASRDEIGRVLAVVSELPEPLAGRAEVAAHMRARGLSEALAQWMTTNVRGSASAATEPQAKEARPITGAVGHSPTPTKGYRWKFDAAVVRALVADYARLDLWPIVESPRPGLAVRGVRGARSDRFSADDLARLDALGAAVVPDAGHWLHADNPDALAEVFARAAREVLAPRDPLTPTG